MKQYARRRRERKLKRAMPRNVENQYFNIDFRRRRNLLLCTDNFLPLQNNSLSDVHPRVQETYRPSELIRATNPSSEIPSARVEINTEARSEDENFCSCLSENTGSHESQCRKYIRPLNPNAVPFRRRIPEFFPRGLNPKAPSFVPKRCVPFVRCSDLKMTCMVLNARSLNNKMIDFANQLDVNEIDVSIVSETWQEKFDKQSFEQLHGVTWIQNSRPDNRQ